MVLSRGRGPELGGGSSTASAKGPRWPRSGADAVSQKHIERIYRKAALEVVSASEEELKEKDWTIGEDKLECAARLRPVVIALPRADT